MASVESTLTLQKRCGTGFEFVGEIDRQVRPAIVHRFEDLNDVAIRRHVDVSRPPVLGAGRHYASGPIRPRHASDWSDDHANSA